MMNLFESKYQNHFYFILLIAIHYLFSIIFTGQVIIDPHDNLEIVVVYDHIISNIYKGDIEKISYFLSGEIKWYNLDKLFYPINILHYVLNEKLFYFTNDILTKLFAYFSFYLLAKSLGVTKFNSALGGVLYSSLIYIKIPLGLALPFLPYILYLLLNKNKLSKKHYFLLFFIGLNSSMIEDVFAVALLIPLSYLISDKNKNLSLYIQIFLLIFIPAILTDIHLVIGSMIGDPIHREAWNVNHENIIITFLTSLKGFLNFNLKSPLFIFYLPLSILSILLLVLPIFLKEKKIKLLIFFIFFILILKSIFGTGLLNNIFVGILEILRGYNFQRVDRIIPLIFSLILIFYISHLKNKKIKNLLYFITFFSIIFIQLKTPLPAISKNYFKKNMHIEKFNEAKNNFLEKKYIKFIKIISNKKNYTTNKTSLGKSINYTFDSYYRFKDYEFIKKIVKDSRVMSVGLDPMIAVMNDIRVIDGYHTIYPLSYKIKFRKIIEKELDKNIKLKNYYDDWGNRVYAFYTDKNNLMLDFKSAKTLGADYIISKFPIKNEELKIICYNCNKSDDIFLYKIL